MDRIYHGCMRKNADCSSRLILRGEKCLVPTSQPFWEYIDDIETLGVKTRTQYKKDHLTDTSKIKLKKILNDGRRHQA